MKTRMNLFRLSFLVLFKLMLFLILCNGTTQLHAQELPYLNTFSASETNGKVYLHWIISSGNTCDGVRVFRSSDGVQYNQIGEISGICGSPYSDVSYEYWDTLPLLNTTSYYKLELGNLGFSLVETLQIYDFSIQSYQLVPHPFSTGGTITFKNPSFEMARLRIFNLHGHLVLEDEQNDNKFQIPVGILKAGIYVFEIVTSERKFLAKGKLIVTN